MLPLLCIASALALTPPPPATRRAVVSSLRDAVVAPAVPAAASFTFAPAAQATECAPQDNECAAARRAAASDNLKENWGGIVGVASLLVIRGVRREQVDRTNPKSFNNVIRKAREDAKKKKKGAR
jgi:hypothetical protein